MARTQSLAKVAILPLLGFSLAMAGGCGGGSVDANPEIAVQRKQARIDAYGKAGIANAKGAPVGRQGGGAQAAARRGGR